VNCRNELGAVEHSISNLGPIIYSVFIVYLNRFSCITSKHITIGLFGGTAEAVFFKLNFLTAHRWKANLTFNFVNSRWYTLCLKKHLRHFRLWLKN